MALWGEKKNKSIENEIQSNFAKLDGKNVNKQTKKSINFSFTKIRIRVIETRHYFVKLGKNPVTIRVTTSSIIKGDRMESDSFLERGIRYRPKENPVTSNSNSLELKKVQSIESR